jgi:hypothetical protein
MPPECIEDLFLDRDRKPSPRALKHPEEVCSDKLFRDEMQCSHVGILSSNPGVVCCLLYDDEDRGNGIESFFNGTCRNFYCQAWYDFTDRQVLFAARLMGDWYYYSLLIHNIEAVHDLCAMYNHPEDVPPDELISLKNELLERMQEEVGT